MKQAIKKIIGYFLLVVTLMSIYSIIVLEDNEFNLKSTSDQISFILVLILFLALAIYLIISAAKHKDNTLKDKDMNTINGFLILVIISLIFSFVQNTNMLIKMFSSYSVELSYLNLNLKTVINLIRIINFEFISILLINFATIILFILMYKKNKMFPIFTILTFVFTMSVGLIDIAFCIINDIPIEIDLLMILLRIIITIGWVQYFINSKRVKNVFKIEKVGFHNIELSKQVKIAFFIILGISIYMIFNIHTFLIK